VLTYAATDGTGQPAQLSWQLLHADLQFIA